MTPEEEKSIALLKRANLLVKEACDLEPKTRGTLFLAAAIMACTEGAAKSPNVPRHPIADLLPEIHQRRTKDAMNFKYAEMALSRYLPELTEQLVIQTKVWRDEDAQA